MESVQPLPDDQERAYKLYSMYKVSLFSSHMSYYRSELDEVDET